MKQGASIHMTVEKDDIDRITTFITKNEELLKRGFVVDHVTTYGACGSDVDDDHTFLVSMVNKDGTKADFFKVLGGQSLQMTITNVQERVEGLLYNYTNQPISALNYCISKTFALVYNESSPKHSLPRYDENTHSYYCNNCNAQVMLSFKYCANCGSKIV